MQTHEVQLLVAEPVGERLVVYVPRGRGEELRLHLASHAIRSELGPTGESFERLEVIDADPVTLQALLDQWER